MATHLDKFFALGEKEREIVKTACKAGDNPMTRQMVQLYFPAVSFSDVGPLINEIRNLSA